MSTGSILSILAYPQYGYHLVCHTGLSLVHCSYLSVGSLQQHGSHVIYLALSRMSTRVSYSSMEGGGRDRGYKMYEYVDVHIMIPEYLSGT